MVQLLKEFENRTEYKVLKNFTLCDAAPIEDLHNGILVVPAIALAKLSQEKLTTLKQWIEDCKNQLIILPTWIEMNVQTYVNATVPIEVRAFNSHYNGIPVNYQIRSSVKEVVFEQNGQVFGINYRRNTGCGLMTIVTLPLLDYKLSEHMDLCRSLFHKLISVEIKEVADVPNVSGELKLDDIHLYLLLLAASDVSFEDGITAKVKKYFNTEATEETLHIKYNELLNNRYICERKASDLGLDYIKQKNLKAFTRTIRERELRSDEWR